MLKNYQQQNKSAFIPYIVAGHPTVEVSERIIDILVEEGVEFLELGVPFTDAFADGPVIQQASESATKTFQSVSRVLEFAKRIKQKHPGLSIILFTYFNPVYKLGFESFKQKVEDANVSAVLVVDLPPEEAQDYFNVLKNSKVKTIFLASPTTTPERLKLIADYSTGFIYYISRLGVTGVAQSISETLEKEVATIRKMTNVPIAIGFGISNGEQARQISKIGDAVVVGSAIVAKMSASTNYLSMEKSVRELIKELLNGIKA